VPIGTVAETRPFSLCLVFIQEEKNVETVDDCSSCGSPCYSSAGGDAQTRITAETHAAAAIAIQPDQIRANKMIGSSVYDVQNRKIGSVKDLVLDKDGKVAAVVVDVGSFLGMGGKYVAINMSDIKADNNRLTLDRTKEQLQQMAQYRLEDRNTGAGTSTSPTTGGRLGH
jgi:sporulation protein YlmC with PRC-barrel domain